MTLMTAREAAEYLRVHPVTLYRYCKEGRVPYTRLGVNGPYRFDRRVLDKYVEAAQKGVEER